MAKQFYTIGEGSSQTLNQINNEKIKIYDSKADADLDLSNIEENEIVATKAGESEGVETFPIGMISPFGGSAAPVGWLICDGSAVSRITYAKLYSVIGEAFGTGDGSTTFNLPDLRESVPKGAGLTSNSTKHMDEDGLSVGEFIEDRIQNITGNFTRIQGTLNTSYGFQVGNPTGAFKGSESGTLNYVGAAGATYTGFSSIGFDASRVARTGNTTEVKSVGVNYIIKY